MPAASSITASSIIADLKAKGTEKARKTYVRHGMPEDQVFGVSVADLKIIAKTIRGQQALACELYQSGMMEAMYLAGLVADGSLMTKPQLTSWAEAAVGMPMISEYTVAWVAAENPHAREVALQWIRSKKEHVASAGWCTYTGLLATMPDEDLDLPEITSLLGTVVLEIGGAENRVRKAMNSFVIGAGAYVTPLLNEAKAAARRMGKVSVDKGDTDCKTPSATEYIEKVEAAALVGRKRKTMRC
jgi:3-methyladenine DNA glycosylase AlkD